jgi:phospholipid/cholesterol/gamma-HCH transport system substrate-binding protein
MRRPQIKPFREMDPVPIGVVFLVSLVALLFLSFNLDKLPFASGTSYSAAFARADGLRKGDRVLVGGVPVGKVEGVTLEGTHVRVDFTITSSSVHLGDASRASIQIATLLGNKYLALEPAGTGNWPSDKELPLTHTATPYDVEPAFQDLASTVGRIDTKQLAAALDTMATTFRDSPASVRSMLSGLSRLSETIASRDAELSRLLGHAGQVTGVLADRRTAFTRLFADGDKLLTTLQQRRETISALLTNTSAMSRQLTGLVHDNQEDIGPALEHLHGVLTELTTHQDELDQIIKGLYVFVRGEVDATGAGPWFDGTAINATNPTQAGPPKTPALRNPRTFGDLLRVPSARHALGGR